MGMKSVVVGGKGVGLGGRGVKDVGGAVADEELKGSGGAVEVGVLHSSLGWVLDSLEASLSLRLD